jgi:short-subunit dehydrogenase
MKASDWHNKVCLITGGSSGLGSSIAKAFAERGAKVIITARRMDPLQRAAAKLGANAEAIAADLTREDDVKRLREAVVQRHVRLDLLCNCAGRSTRGSALDATVDDFLQLLDVNFLAAVRMTRSFAPLLIEQQGHIVNVGSLASKIAPRYLGAYPASKFALAAYSQQLRLELGPQGLHVLLVCPGPILRDAAEPRYADESADLPDAAQQPAAGAKLRGIDPDRLAARIVTACERREPELVVPWKVRLLLAISQFSPKLGDWLLLRATGD